MVSKPWAQQSRKSIVETLAQGECGCPSFSVGWQLFPTTDFVFNTSFRCFFRRHCHRLFDRLHCIMIAIALWIFITPRVEARYTRRTACAYFLQHVDDQGITYSLVMYKLYQYCEVRMCDVRDINGQLSSRNTAQEREGPGPYPCMRVAWTMKLHLLSIMQLWTDGFELECYMLQWEGYVLNLGVLVTSAGSPDPPLAQISVGSYP